MEKNLKIFNYNNNSISFKVGETTMINATQMAKPFDNAKRPQFWLNNQQTRDFLNALSKARNLALEDLVRITKGGNNPGTWMHEDVALEFARWLSPAFAIWCNDRIKELPNKPSHDSIENQQIKSNKTDLLKITENNGQPAVSARELHAFLESKQRFSDWITKRISKYQFTENEDFEVFHKFMKNPSGGRPLDEYVLSLDMAKELCMVENNEKGRQARRYFIETEKRYQTERYNNLKKEKKGETFTDKAHLMNAFATLEPDLENNSNTVLTLNFLTTRECFLQTILPLVKLNGGKYRGNAPGYLFTAPDKAEEAQKEINTLCFNYMIPIISLNNTSRYALRELGMYEDFKRTFKLKEKLYA